MAEDGIHIDEDSSQSLEDWDAGTLLERVTEVVPSLIYVFNQKTQSNEYTNRSIGSAMGYSAEEILGMGSSLMQRICHPDDLPSVFAHFKKIGRLKDGEIAKIEYRCRHKSGHWVWLLSHDQVFDRDDDGTVIRHIGSATDITEQKVAEESAKFEKSTATNANDELRTFAYSVSHDLKSPLNTLAALLGELERKDLAQLDADAPGLLASADATVERMRKKITDILSYTMVIGRVPKRRRMPLKLVIQECLADLGGEIADSDATIRVENLPAIVGSESELGMLFQNLIGNAIKFRNPDIAPKIVISDETVSGATKVTIAVSDNGIGIPPSDHDRIFEMFGRLHTEEDYPGSGLGLAICRRIAQSHGGDILVESDLGEGAVFKVTLSKA